MGVPTVDIGPMTVEEFYEFTDTRPDEEKWELIDGEPILNAAPSELHQLIVRNVLFSLTLREREQNGWWRVLPGLGVRVSERNRPEPDVVVLPRSGPSLARDRSDLNVAFEVLSPSTANYDFNWKRSAYTKLPSLTHYVVVAQDVVEVVVFARATAFAEQRFRSLRDCIEFPSLGVSLRLTEIYHDTRLAESARA